MYLEYVEKHNFFQGVWDVFRYLFLTPSWGSKRRAEQRAYEERLDEAMKAKDASEKV